VNVDNDALSCSPERKRAAGKLPPFDPSGPDIHPKSRVRMVITINKSLAARPPVSTTPSDGDTQPDESYAGSDDEAEDAAESSEEEWANDPTEGTPPRRSERNKVVKNLPFSPKKTRFRKTFFVGEDGEDEDDSSSAVPTRRNPRRTRATSASPDAEDEYRVSDDQEEDRPKRKGKGKTKRHSRSSASSGPVHAAEDFDYDSDEDTAPLRAHRHSCERCGERPSHLLKKKTRRRKNRDEDDEFEDEGGLGGWLKWSVRSTAGCLAFIDVRPAQDVPSLCTGDVSRPQDRTIYFVLCINRK
jgi:chromodomain-helicase-DNA-binding protein 4